MQRMSEGGDCPRERMQGACMRPCSPALGGMRQYMWKPLRLDNSHGCLIKNDCGHMVYEPVDDRLVDVRLDVTPQNVLCVRCLKSGTMHGIGSREEQPVRAISSIRFLHQRYPKQLGSVGLKGQGMSA